MTVDAVVYFRVVNPEGAVVKVKNFTKATFLVAHTTLRSVLGQHELDELLTSVPDQSAAPAGPRRYHRAVGIKATIVAMQDAILPDGMKRATAKQAETEQEGRAKVINAF